MVMHYPIICLRRYKQ